MWYEKFDFRQLYTTLVTLTRACMCRHYPTSPRYTLFCVWMTKLIVRKDKVLIVDLKKKLHAKFSMKELREAQHTLGMRMGRERSKQIQWFSQTECVWKVFSAWRIRSAQGHYSQTQPNWWVRTLPQLKRRKSNFWNSEGCDLAVMTYYNSHQLLSDSHYAWSCIMIHTV
mgnify:CR=1 FL=1